MLVVDVGDQVVLGLGSPRETVVGEGQLAGIDLQDGFHLRVEAEDGFLFGDGVIHPLNKLSIPIFLTSGRSRVGLWGDCLVFDEDLLPLGYGLRTLRGGQPQRHEAQHYP
jgi:hypothetical protein